MSKADTPSFVLELPLVEIIQRFDPELRAEGAEKEDEEGYYVPNSPPGKLDLRCFDVYGLNCEDNLPDE